MVINLTKNFANILKALEERGHGPTYIAREMGYTTTTQLNSVISGESQLSTKAIIGLIDRLKVNPMYLFLEKGDMFLSEKSESDRLQNENRNLFIQNNDALKTIVELTEKIKQLEKRKC
jgi:UDP-N-acetylmuramate-alanine ligase